MKVIGLALRPEKLEKHVSETLVQRAREAGFLLKFLDPSLPLEEQGPLDAVLQKLRKPEWEEQLERYAQAHPHVKVFDRPAATLSIRNRRTMLTMLEGEGWLFQDPVPAMGGQQRTSYKVCVPTHLSLPEGATLPAASAELREAGLRYPLLAKPVWADGRAGSHALAVIGNEAGLQKLVEGRAAEDFGLPVLLQQYVDHGGCLFKVYVLGSTVVMVKRSSLQLQTQHSRGDSGRGCTAAKPPTGSPAATAAAAAAAPQQAGHPHAGAPQCMLHADARAQMQEAGAALDLPRPTQARSPLASEPPPDLELMQRVSAYPRCKSWGKWDTAPKGHGVVGPPTWLVQQLAQRLRRHLGLNLFNFDLIMPLSSPQQQPGWAAPAENGHSDNGKVVGHSSSAAAGGRSSFDAEQQRHAEEEQQQRWQEPRLLYLIDINYFPGYEKLPGYEELMVQFFTSIWAEATTEGGGAPQE